MPCSLQSSLISVVGVHRHIQSQAHWNVVSKASQLGYKSHLFNFLSGDKKECVSF